MEKRGTKNAEFDDGARRHFRSFGFVKGTLVNVANVL
jgi:Fe2+ transport system protein FeoA